MTAISRQSQQCNRIGVIINRFCRLVGRQPGVQKKKFHSIYKTFSLVNCMGRSRVITVQLICVRSC